VKTKKQNRAYHSFHVNLSHKNNGGSVNFLLITKDVTLHPEKNIQIFQVSTEFSNIIVFQMSQLSHNITCT